MGASLNMSEKTFKTFRIIMTPEQLQELKEKAELWDSLSDSLRTIFCGKFERPYVLDSLEGEVIENGKGAEQFNKYLLHNDSQKTGTSTIENISNASSHIGLLREENKEMVEVKDGEIKTFSDDPRTQRPFCPPNDMYF